MRAGEAFVDHDRHFFIADVPLGYVAAFVVAICAATIVMFAPQLRQSGSEPKRELLKRPERASAILQPFAIGQSPKSIAQAPKKGRRARSSTVTCLRPGPTNTVANCKGDGFPAVEPTIAANRNLVVAAAADYNSYNGQPQFGFYWSRRRPPLVGRRAAGRLPTRRDERRRRPADRDRRARRRLLRRHVLQLHRV